MSETTNTSPEAPAPKKSNTSTIIIVLMAIVIIVQGVFIYLGKNEEKVLIAEKRTIEEELDETKVRMQEIKTELEAKILEVQKLGGDVSDLEKAKADIEAQLKRQRQATGKELKALKDKVEGYEELLKLKDEEIDKLKNVNKQLLTENTTLKTQKNELGDSINRLSETKEKLETKVAIASQLKAENVAVLAVSEKGKERPSPFKNRQVGKIKVEFNIAENEVAPIEGKKIMIRIIDENNQVIFDVARGSGTFIYEGKEEFYTASQEILFDNTKQKLTYLYEKGSDYASGTYTVEIYTDGYKMGTAQFVVK